MESDESDTSGLETEQPSKSDGDSDLEDNEEINLSESWQHSVEVI